MTLDELKTILETTALEHKEVHTFDFGENFEAAINGNYNYPAIFMEIPVLINYTDNNQRKTFTFAIDIFDKPEFDDKSQGFDMISNCEVIGDAYFRKLKVDNATTFFITSIDATTFRHSTDDDLAGVRYELIITTNRQFCNDEYKTEFEDS